LAIVADDGSTDGSRDVIAPFLDERIRLVLNPRNIGYIATLRRLLAEASTDIVGILDADDAVAPDATEQLLRAYADSGAELVYSRYAVYDASLVSPRDVHGRAIPEGGTAVCEGVVGAIRSFRRRTYERTTGLDDTMLYAEDRDLVYKLEEVTRPVFVDAVLYRYRDVAESQSRDPEKREIGARNTWRARRAAFRRRKLAGVERLCYELFAWADYLAYSERRSQPVRRAANAVASAARALCRQFAFRAPLRTSGEETLKLRASSQ
jgi:glycosyltransferase involved in cell wall biosynthesis